MSPEGDVQLVASSLSAEIKAGQLQVLLSED